MKNQNRERTILLSQFLIDTYIYNVDKYIETDIIINQYFEIIPENTIQAQSRQTTAFINCISKFTLRKGGHLA